MLPMSHAGMGPALEASEDANIRVLWVLKQHSKRRAWQMPQTPAFYGAQTVQKSLKESV